jgi:peptide/nickel transport system permease protein
MTDTSTSETPRQRASSRSASVRGVSLGATGWVGAVVLVGVVLLCIAAPVVTPHDPLVQDTGNRLLPPTFSLSSQSHLLGTDSLGRDLLSRLLNGGRISLLVGFMTVLIAGSIGLLLGLLSGYIGGPLDTVIQTIAYAQLSMPVIVLAVAVMAVSSRGLFDLIVVMVVASWVPSARLVRGVVLATKERQFVEAARTIGATHTRIVGKHILPHVAGVFLALAALQIGWMISFESALSFLGLGVQPPAATWGGMISDGREYIYVSPWVSILPGLALAITVLAVNAVARGARDALDPRSRRH